MIPDRVDVDKPFSFFLEDSQSRTHRLLRWLRHHHDHDWANQALDNRMPIEEDFN